MIAYFRTQGSNGEVHLQKTSGAEYKDFEEAVNDVTLLVQEIGGLTIVSPILCVINGGKF